MIIHKKEGEVDTMQAMLTCKQNKIRNTKPPHDVAQIQDTPRATRIKKSVIHEGIYSHIKGSQQSIKVSWKQG